MTMMGPLLTRWTIRLSLLLYVAVLAGGIVVGSGGESKRWPRASRWMWTAACLLFLVHVGCAFHFYHRWSHTEVLADTARQTKELIGWEFGEGIYFSYAFTLLWVADVAWWWLGQASYRRRPRWLAGLVHGFMFFIAINGAIVFEAGVTRWFGAMACGLLVLLLARRVLGKKEPAPLTSPSPAHE